MKYIITEQQYKLLLENQDLNIDLEQDDVSLTIYIKVGDTSVGEIILEKEGKNTFTIVDANISPDYRGKGLYYKSIFKIFDVLPNIKINSSFRSGDADRSWKSLIKKLPEHLEININRQPETTIYQIKRK
jgi:predicted RNA-binding protein YlqC (UPF0109 family)